MTDYWLVFSNAAEGEDAEFNEWYDNKHIPDLLEIDGFASAQRYKLTEGAPGNEAGTHEYIAIYEFDADPAVALGNFFTAVGNGLDLGTTMDNSPERGPRLFTHSTLGTLRTK